MLAPDQIARLPLAPLLAAEGLWVRWRALQLPEPPGPRAGGDGTGLRVLILGDSSAAGVGAETQAAALSGQLARALGGSVTWHLEAKTGATTRESLAKVDGLPEGPFDLALLVHGVNDTTRFRSARRFHAEQSRLIAGLRAARGVRGFVLSGLPPMQHFPLLPQPLRWVLGCHAARLDRVLKGLAAAREDCVHLPLNLPYEPRYVARDGFHPSEDAYAVWADMLSQVIRAQARRI